MSRLPYYVVMAASLGIVGCVTDPAAVVDPVAETQMRISADQYSHEIGEDFTFTVIASNTDMKLTSASIDFEGDTIWDETHPHDWWSLETTFTHSYATAGEYHVRANVMASNDTWTIREAWITVTDPAPAP